MKIFVRYQDDGPIGPGPQCCSITNPWDQMHIFENEDKGRQFIKEVKEGKEIRENQRITGIWWHHEIIMHGV